MKVLYLETKKKTAENIDLDSSGLPKELFLAYSIQYKQIAEQIKSILEKRKTKISGFQQVLGCSKLNPSSAILLIGSGRFHAKNSIAE